MFGLRFMAITLDEAAARIAEAARAGRKAIVVTPNVDHLVRLDGDDKLRSIYEDAAFVLADGMPLVWLSKLLKGPSLPERVAGSDLLIRIAELAPAYRLRLFFLGGMPGVADRAADRLAARFPGLQVVGAYSPPFDFEDDNQETEKIIEMCNVAQPHIVFVGVGAPKQERWSSRNLARLNVGAIVCCGASLDFAAGHVRRAPRAVQRVGFEWLWRLSREPGRLWKRYLLRDPRFLAMALRELARQRERNKGS